MFLFSSPQNPPELNPIRIFNGGKEENSLVGTPKEILGITIIKGNVFYLVKFEEDQANLLVPSSQLRERFPQLIISYYEGRVRFVTTDNECE